MSPIAPFTFNFNGKNSKSDFGIYATSYDFLLPSKRQRRQTIPFKSGSYDFGAQWYNDRILRLKCLWVATESITRAQIRYIAYWLSKKGKIELAIEPDKYYIGELYDATELIAHYNYSQEPGATTDGDFELDFVCEPFAYGAAESIPLSAGINDIQYKGTAETPTLIIINNPNTFAISNITITAIQQTGGL